MSQPSPGTSTWQKVLRAALIALAIAAFLLALRWINNAGLLKRALDWIRELGPYGPAAFVVIYVAAVIFFIPASILTVGAGFIFGLAWGSVYVLLAATIAGNLTFLIARHVAREWIAHKLQTHPKFKALDDAVARDGWKIVALVRLAPVFPFAITSYGFGLTRLQLWEYFLANFAMIPGTMMYVYFGNVARDLTDRIATPPWIKWSIGALTVAVVLYVTQYAKRALAQKVS